MLYFIIRGLLSRYPYIIWTRPPSQFFNYINSRKAKIKILLQAKVPQPGCATFGWSRILIFASVELISYKNCDGGRFMGLGSLRDAAQSTDNIPTCGAAEGQPAERRQARTPTCSVRAQ